MVEKIIEFSAKNKFLVLILTGALILTALWCAKRIPLDAIPDLSDTQVIIYSRWDRSPDIMEDQVTYPIVTAMLGTPKVKAVRGFSDFGYSYVYVIFQDGTDIYWARSRVLEYLSKIMPQLPEGVRTEMGPDATSVGWIYQYAISDETGRHDLAELRSLQDWYLRYALQSVPGVAEVAGAGGFVRQIQIQVDPNRLRAYNISIPDLVDAVRKGNRETGGRVLEISGAEYMVRSRGYAKSIEDIENIHIPAGENDHSPHFVKHVAKVQAGPEIRRGVLELDGKGDAVGGVIVMRHGENALQVIDRVKQKIHELEPTLPEGVKIIETYDRSKLIKKSISTLKHTLIEEVIIVSLVILLFLWHIPSALIPITTIPIAVLLSFIPMYLMGLTSNIMSLAGIAISIGVLVDGAIIEVENAYKKLQLWDQNGRKGDYHQIRLDALKEVGPSVFFSLLVIAAAFIPVFTLVDQEGRLFKPLAYSKNFAMAIAAVLAITLDPAMRMLFTRMDPIVFFKSSQASWLRVISAPFSKAANAVLVGKYYPEEKHPVSRVIFKLYEPAVHFVLKHRFAAVFVSFLLVAGTIPVYFKLGSEFMPPLNEGDILYMPTALPGMSVTEAQRILQIQDKMLKSFPEVDHVFGKAGRVESPTDPAPFSMVETTVTLKPRSEWRTVPREFPGWVPEWARKISPERPITFQELVDEMDRTIRLPGIPNVWTMPIKNRIDMLSTGIRTPVGIKVLGPDLKIIQKIGEQLEGILKKVDGARNVYAERAAGGYFLDFELNRQQLARFGLTVEEVQDLIMYAVGGENVTVLVEGRKRTPVNIRLARDYRDSIPKLKQLLVSTPLGVQVPLGDLAEFRMSEGPAMIRDENGMLAGYVYVDISGRDVGSFVKAAKKAVEAHLETPKGYLLVWSGQYENMNRVRERLKTVIPLTLFIIAMLLYFNTKSWVKTMIVLTAVPFSLIGAVWLLHLLDYNISIAVWVGMIALMGLDAETGVFMLLFLDLAHDERVKEGRMKTYEDLKEAIIHGAVKRARPKMMTVLSAMIGLLPIMWAQGEGADMMKRIAAPMIGGLTTSFILELLIYPALYAIWKWDFGMKKQAV